MQTNIEFSDNILTVETFKDIVNVIHDLEFGQLKFSEPIRKVIIKNLSHNLEKYEVQDYLFSSQLKELEAVDIIDSGQGFCSDDGLVYTADFKYLVFCPLGRRGTVKIHEGTENVYEYACYECNFNHLIIPSSVRRVEKYAFNLNRLLEYVDGGEGLESIGDMSFKNCTSLKDFSFGPNLKGIGEYAFRNTQLTKILLPEGLEYVGSQAFNTANIKDNGEISHITPDKMYDIHLPVSLKEIGKAAFCNASNIYTKEANLNTVRAGARANGRLSGTSFSHDCNFWKLHIEGLQPIVMPKEMDSIRVIARRVRLYAEGKITSPPEIYSESGRMTKYATALEHRKLYPGKDVDEFLNKNIKKVFTFTLMEDNGERLMADYIKSGMFTNEALQNLVEYIEKSNDFSGNSLKYTSLKAYALQAMKHSQDISQDIFEI